MKTLRDKFFRVFPGLRFFLRKEEPTGGEWFTSDNELWFAKFNLASPILDLTSRIKIMISPTLQKVCKLYIDGSEFKVQKIYDLVNSLFGAFGSDSNGISKEECFEYPENIQLCWIIGVNENQEFVCQESYDNFLFMITIFVQLGIEGMGEGLDIEVNFIHDFTDDTIKSNAIDFADFGLDPSVITYQA